MKQVCKLKKKAINSFVQVKVAWLDFSMDTFLPSLSIYYVAINKYIGKSLPQLQIYYDPCFNAIGVAMAT